jgi:putative transcriptional regulator|tara:strand:- start:8492 stop:9037 length:546 start_codon:yes stop_codon:yes gene_type:complete
MGTLKNQILISMPHMTDLFFSKSVVYICEHSNNGAMGIIINKQFKDQKLKTVLETISEDDNPIVKDIFFGGPVLLEKGLVLHESRHRSDNTVNISKSISITGTLEVLKDLQSKSDVSFKLILGHSGWSQGQLEKEIENGDWLIQNTTPDFIFNIQPEQMWTQAAESLGIDFGVASNISGQA